MPCVEIQSETSFRVSYASGAPLTIFATSSEAISLTVLFALPSSPLSVPTRDEFNLGHGNEIEIAYNSHTGIIVVTDKGQGFIPNSFRDDGKTILEAAFSVLNTSGKYREDGVYEGTSLGSFGIGSKIATYLSHWLNVSTARDGINERISFVEGVFNKRDVEVVDKENHGTSIQFLPSEQFFDNPAPNVEALKKLFKETAPLCTGLKIIF